MINLENLSCRMRATMTPLTMVPPVQPAAIRLIFPFKIQFLFLSNNLTRNCKLDTLITC